MHPKYGTRPDIGKLGITIKLTKIAGSLVITIFGSINNQKGVF
jgi:hypothetical protein